MAIDQDKKFIVYKSSAGSGKTFTLVREYLRIVLKNPESFRQVLAITFTNKAANEMKDRVLKNLVVLAEPEKNPDSDTIIHMLPKLSAQLNLGHAEIKSRAEMVLRLIMHHYAEFAVSTIDSFTHRVIRTFSHDLKIPMNFEVDLDADLILSEAVDLLVSQVGTEEKLTRVMIDFIEKKTGEEQSWQIEKDLNDFSRSLLSESSIDAVNEIRNYDLESFMKVRNSLMQWKITWEKFLSSRAKEIYDLINNEGLTSGDFIQKDRGIINYLKSLSAGMFDKIKPNSFAETAFKSGEWISQKSSPNQKAAFQRIENPVLDLGKQIYDRICHELPRYVLCKLLLNNLFSTALLCEVEKTLNSLCLDNNKLLISEFNRRISQIVREQPAPFIYERLGEKYHHFLIDEFQDTSIMQWHNLLPLIENSLASSRMNMVVGDAKQAIYRWRSGDAEQFEKLPYLIRPDSDALLGSREKTLVSQYKKEDLDENFRSSPVIVDFNNRLFESIFRSMPQEHGIAYKNVRQTAAKKDKPGMVKLMRIGKPDAEDEKYDQKVHAKIKEIIGELSEDQFNFKDIAILCRKNEKAAKIAAFLISHDIPVISSESLLLTQSEQVNFIIAWMQHLDDPADSIPMAHIFNYLLAGEWLKNVVPEDYFVSDPTSQTKRFHQLLKDQLPYFNPDHLKKLEIFSLVQHLIFHFKLYTLNDSYIGFFQDAVLEFIKNARGGIADFLEWWEEKREKLSVVIPDGIDAVRIMTIHKSKGLQFPVVIYPFADESLRSTRDNLWVALDEDFARPLKTASLPVSKTLTETIYREIYEDEINRSYNDMVNVLYVAVTRPEERLYVLLKDIPEKTEDTPSVPKLISRFLMEENLWEKDRDCYQFGERWKKDAILAEAFVPEVSPENSRPELKMLLRRHAPEIWDMEELEKNREWGNLVHHVLSMVDRENSANKILKELSEQGIILSFQQQELATLIDSLMNKPDIARFFGPEIQVMNEPEILTADGRIYRPDRVLINRDMVTVIDFKTGKPYQEHQNQVLAYTELLSAMNYQIEGAYLLYLDKDPKLVRVC